MIKPFGVRADGQQTYLYTISCDGITAEVSDHGATLVKLFVPDNKGNVADVVLGHDCPDDYTRSGEFFGATVGRNSNRVANARFELGGNTYMLEPNDNGVNNLHSGSDPYKNRLWTVTAHSEDAITLHLSSPDGDQGFPGNAEIEVTYRLEKGGNLRVVYHGICDRDTVFNMTNHSYFNLAGHHKPELAMEQVLTMTAEYFNPNDAMSIPTGEVKSVEGTPMDFRQGKPLGKDINEDCEELKLQGGYDHNFVLKGGIFATLYDPASGRTMEVITDCPGVHLYTANGLNVENGKDGVHYCDRAGVCLETQFFPDAVNHPEWQQPFVKAGQPYHSETVFRFSW